MNFNKFKAKVQKLAELSWPDLRDLFTWPCNSTIQADNQNLLIAKAVDESGEVVAYVTAEPILLVDSYVLNPQSNREDDQKAGAAIDAALAQHAGVQRMLVCIPDGAPPMEGERVLRVFERKVYQPVSNTQWLSSDTPSPAAYIN
jgi:hypothetical protein